MQDDAGAKEADAGQHALHHAAQGIGIARLRRRIAHGQGHGRGAERDEAERTQPGRFAMQVAVEADTGTDQRRYRKPQHNLRKIEHRVVHRFGHHLSGRLLNGQATFA
jgi:hypothetical protein